MARGEELKVLAFFSRGYKLGLIDRREVSWENYFGDWVLAIFDFELVETV